MYMNIIQDYSNHKGEHEQIVTTCLCTESPEPLYLDYDKEQIVCSICGNSRPMLNYYPMQSEEEIINSYLE